MVDLSNAKHHPVMEAVVDVLCNQTRNTDRRFFRVLTAYYLAVIASTMRAQLNTRDRGVIPVNSYTLALAPSGFGKGHSTYILENHLIGEFRRMFLESVLPDKAELNMRSMASKRAARSGETEDDEYDKLSAELQRCGEFPFVFDGASEPAIKQVRQILLLTGCGSINLQVDEIGLNLDKIGEALTTYLELYDQGLVKAKLTKNSHENKRTKEILGKTPANLLAFGAPVKLLDGGQTEKRFYGLLDTGYARRCLFAFGNPKEHQDHELTPAELYKLRTDPNNAAVLDQWAQHLASLADLANFDWMIDVPDPIGIELLEYQMECEAKALAMSEYDEIRKAEMTHRYFKALKLAGVYAFIDQSSVLTQDHLHSALKLVEESGNSFQAILSREPAYAKLARYIAYCGTEMTHADLDMALPFYKGSSASARNDMMALSSAWGYKNHIIIQKSFSDGIEFFSGETLQETKLDKVRLSYSEDFAHNYEPVEVPFDQLHLLTQEQGMHWASHHFENGHRNEANAIPGFNLMVIDIDGGISIQNAIDLMEDHAFLLYTTKRHTPENNRFRMVFPMNYWLKLDQDEYREFCANFEKWLPFATDASTYQRSRKWASCDIGSYQYNMDGKLLDVLPFIPRTSRNEEYKKGLTQLGSLDNLERWFAQRFAEGDRNNLMAKYTLALVDSGLLYPEIETRVLEFNKKLSNGLTADELRKTVLVTAAKKLQGVA